MENNCFALSLQLVTVAIITQLQTATSTTHIDHIATPQDDNARLRGSSNDAVISQDSNTMLMMQSDGNLVLSTRSNALTGSVWTVQWNSSTANIAANGRAVLQWDGNLVLYDSTWSVPAAWKSDSWTGGSKSPNVLVVSNGGYAYIVTRTNEITWQINTAETIIPSLTFLDTTCTFTVLSIDHTESDYGKWFHFDRSTVDIILGHTNWYNQNFTIYNSRTQQLSKIVLWNTVNGGSIGDAHGRKQFPDVPAERDWEINDMLTFIGIDCFTSSPTVSPTLVTVTPTTNTPTSNTASPSLPTNVPSLTTKSPSYMPTNYPTKSPTSNTSPPTVTPTHLPSKLPTRSPTDEGQANDKSTQSNPDATTDEGASIGGSKQTNGQLLIVIILTIIGTLMFVGCIFMVFCFWKQHRKTELQPGALKRESTFSPSVTQPGERENTITAIQLTAATSTEPLGEGIVSENNNNNSMKQTKGNDSEDEVTKGGDIIKNINISNSNGDDIYNNAQDIEEPQITKGQLNNLSAVHLEILEAMDNNDNDKDKNINDGKPKEDELLDAMLSDVLHMKSLDPNKIHEMNVNDIINGNNNDTDSDDSDNMYD